MSKKLNISGYWTGKIEGTNHGGFAIQLNQSDDKLTGTAKISEPQLGEYEYEVKGTISKEISLHLTPTRNTHGIQLGPVNAICAIDAEGKLVGRWKSQIGTEGILSASKFDDPITKSQLPKSNSVFLVHGHDEGAKHSIARFLSAIGVEPVILQEQINRGMTVIEKFEDLANRAGFAVILMTPDDYGYPVNKEEEKKPRPRQNVVLELGYFAGCLGRNKTFVLTKGDLDIPSDIIGLVYERMDLGEGWKLRLARELKVAGFDIDLNSIV